VVLCDRYGERTLTDEQEGKLKQQLVDIYADNVPINSIMREFIGGGCFRV